MTTFISPCKLNSGPELSYRLALHSRLTCTLPDGVTVARLTLNQLV